ncbi:hypothetical protein H6P81_012021 [Aristolochia fimbriata]|uniref:Uncharacterized protein n=1 Tax=Aristolochia fimbriata TaxID=158543 RepID=A0AAV7EF82_ARIFI|nr:hypothetical protein H6P81_012021 [Aristolochia fimbriata]
MESSSKNARISAAVDHEVDDWDAEGFVIPSLETNQEETEREQSKINQHEKEGSGPVLQKSSRAQKETKANEEIYLGPHGTSLSLLINRRKTTSSASRWKEDSKSSRGYIKKNLTHYHQN